jgi:hypothetical protein
MATEQQDMPQSATKSILTTIQGMHFFIQTAHGISPSFYTSTESVLILGVLQGTGAAPCTWLSCILLQALQPHTTGFQASCPCKNCISQCTGEAFVDDTSLWLTGTNPFTPTSTLVSTMQEMAKVWEHLLFASNGALALQKCFYYLVSWKWTFHSFPFLSCITDSPTTLLQMTSG